MTLSSAASRAALPVALLITCAVGAAMLANGLRASFGLFLAPMTAAHAWTASGFAFAIALQVLLNGVFQPFIGQLADRFGGRAVIIGGALLYALGILGMAFSTSLPLFTFFAGVVLGAAVSAAGMPTIIASLTRMLPEEKRGRAAGLGTAGTSAGQFLVVPLAGFGISGFGWQWAMVAMALAALVIIPLALPLSDRPAPVAALVRSQMQAARRAGLGTQDVSALFAHITGTR
jgi:MFS family permease